MEKDLVKFASARAAAKGKPPEPQSKPKPKPKPKQIQQELKGSATKEGKLKRILSNLERSFRGQLSLSKGGQEKSEEDTERREKMNIRDEEVKRENKITINNNKNAQAAAMLANSAVAAAKKKRQLSEQSAKLVYEKQDQKQVIALQQDDLNNNNNNNNDINHFKTKQAQARELQINSEPSKLTRSKMTLNKCQQQIVSTLRLPNKKEREQNKREHENQHQLQQLGCGGGKHQMLAGNKLSIPPPHANDEARNQNHRLLFGQQQQQQQQQQPHHHHQPLQLQQSETFDTNKSPQQPWQQFAPSPAKSLDGSHHNHNHNHHQHHNHQLARPLEQTQHLAKSSLSIHKLQTGEQELDDSSGFSNYHSRRSLLNDKMNPINGMLIMQQAPNFANSHPSNQMRFLANNNNNNNNYYQNLQQNTHQQQVQQTSNQVPIIQHQPIQQLHQAGHFYSQQANQSRPFSSDFYTLYPTHKQQQQQQQQLSYQTNFLPQYTIPQISSQNQTSSLNLDGNSNLNQNQYQHQHQNQNQAQPNHHNIQNTSQSMEQQIYANAPPKPRRYQYYEAHSNQPQVQHNATLLQQYRQQAYNLPMSQQPKAPVYNLTYLQPSPVMTRANQPIQQAPPAFLPRHQQQSQSQAQLIQQPLQRQQPSLLTKSKSSLDIRDLMSYKQQQHQQQQHQLNSTSSAMSPEEQHFNTLRHQQPLQRLALYGSQVISRADQCASTAFPPLINSLYQPTSNWLSYGTNSYPTNNNRTIQQSTIQTQPTIQQHQLSHHNQRPFSTATSTASNKLLTNEATATTVISVNSDPSSNSQLIVDLTTPRVLAKTQTTLFPSTNPDSPNSWSINQSGLPAIKQQQQQQQQQLPINNNLSSSQQQSPANLKHKNDLDRPPYYYSDLKSNEQQQALLNIVQQKSLSPPPALLSRSTDQNNTRLAPKSATINANQAQPLNDAITARQLHLNLMQIQQQHQRNTQNQLNQQNQLNNTTKQSNTTTGILKTSKSSPSASLNSNSASASSSSNATVDCDNSTNHLMNNNNNNNNVVTNNNNEIKLETSQTDRQSTIGSSRDSRLSLDSDSKSTTIRFQEAEAVGLGNVIDVDACSLNMSQFSPFNSNHLLQHHQSLTILN